MRTNKTAAALLFVAAAAAVTPASAQDERRRPGQRADRPDTTAKPAEPAKKKPAPATPAATTPPAETRRRPGDPGAAVPPATPPKPAVPVIPPATAPAIVAPVPVPTPAQPAAPAAGERRRPGQPSYTRPTESGERLEPGAPSRGGRNPFTPNRRSGLKPVAKPSPQATYPKERVADRWQLTRALGITDYSLFDPYNQNTLKADRPVHGDWFLNAILTSDTVFEPRRVPTPVGAQGEAQAGQLNVIGSGDQTVLAQTFIGTLVYYQGDTTFRPPDWEFHLTAAYQFNRVEVDQVRALRVDPRAGTDREDDHVGLQEAFIDKHLRNVSDRFDFDSFRIGIQPFTADFRGFLFQDLQLGARLFGTRDNNLWQYNLAYFRRLEKDTNSLLNDAGKSLRKDDIFVANLYRQDFPVLGHTSQLVLLHNRNREGEEGRYFNNNGFIERPASLGREAPRNYDVTYLGANGDGHFGRYNLSSSAYLAFGDQDQGVVREGEVDIRAFFLAAEASIDYDWRRFRLSALYASADDEPFDDVETGFDAVFENPIFAGADTSYWIRQSVPLIGGGIVGIAGRNGVLNSLRSSLAEGQSNFANPGTVLLGVGADFDFTPTFRVSFNLNQLWFADSNIVEVFRNQGPIDEDIGQDVSVATIWRPFMSQNVILRSSAAALIPGKGFEQLFGDETGYSVLINLILTY